MQNRDMSDVRSPRSPELISAQLQPAIEAVCNELGIARFEIKRREAVAKRIEAAWKVGRVQPLYLVDAGLSGT